MGRRLPAQSVAGYSPENFESLVARSQTNLETDCLDLVQLHCPPTDLFYHPEVFAALDELVSAGKIANYGVSVERVEEALKALDYPGVATIQIIYNIFRQRPAERLFPAAQLADVGIIARVPLASGLLTGKITADTVFPANDHRNYNRHGEAFDVGETFSGVDIEAGLAAVEKIQAFSPKVRPLRAWRCDFAARTQLSPRLSREPRRRAGARQRQRRRAPRAQRGDPGPFPRDLPVIHRPVGSQPLVTGRAKLRHTAPPAGSGTGGS